jgi:N-acyl-D-amino-acid deacylase
VPEDLLAGLIAEGGDGVQIVELDRMAEDDVRAIVARPDVAVASDGWTLACSSLSRPHPRSFGTFARVLGHYVRDEGILPLASGVRKMTAIPARRLGMAKRGRLSDGAVADIVVVDPASVRDRATYDDPCQQAEGVIHVLVAGQPVMEDTAATGATPGRVLRRRERDWPA